MVKGLLLYDLGFVRVIRAEKRLPLLVASVQMT